MLNRNMTGLFITGTDTGVGKTYVTGLLARSLRKAGLRPGIYKPVCSGAEFDEPSGTWRWPDLDLHVQALENEHAVDLICPQRFQAPLAPPVAARLEGREVDSRLLRTGASAWQGIAEVLLVEGVGGWQCPLSESETCADLAADLNWPVLIVAANRLGTINHTLLTLESVRNAGRQAVGIVLNQTSPAADASAETNADVLRRMAGVPVVGPLSYDPATDADWDWNAFPIFDHWAGQRP